MPGDLQPQKEQRVSKLVAIGYDSVADAEDALATVGRLANEHLVELDDTVIVERKPNGKVKLHQARGSTTATGAAGGALWGGLIGLIFLMPLFGAAIGAATGAAAGAATDIGVNDNFMKEVGAHLEEGKAALFVLFTSATADKVLPEIAKHGGKVIQTSLDTEAEEALKHALEARTAAA
jgi:uncharacterized membrane protein